MEFSCSRRVQAKLSHPDRKNAASPDFSIHLQALLAILPLLDPKIPWLSSPCVVFLRLSFSSYYFPRPCFCYIITLGTLPFSITSLLRHLPLRSSHKRAGRQEGVPRTSSSDPFLPRYTHCCI